MIRKIFTITATVSVLLNFYLDFRMAMHINKTHEVGEWINRSNEILTVIDKMMISALQEAGRTDPPSWPLQIPQLREMIAQNPPLDQMASDLERQIELTADERISPAQKSIRLVKILNEMRSHEEARLADRLSRERDQSAINNRQILWANIVDIFLVSILMFFFWYEWITHRRMRLDLTESLERLNSINAALMASDLSRTDLLKTTVHDLKNPLGSIRGFAELINHEAVTTSVVEMSETIQKISNNTLNLVNSLLQQGSARAGGGSALQNLDLRETLADVCRFLKPVAEGKQQRIDFKPTSRPCWIHGDPQALHGAFYNLVGNSLKFSKPGTSVSVHMHCDSQDAQVVIRDQGPGFSEEDLRKVFQFGQVLSAKPTGNETSTGLGLYSAKKAIDLHHGRLDVANHEKGGACLTVHLPLTSLAKEGPHVGVASV